MTQVGGKTPRERARFTSENAQTARAARPGVRPARRPAGGTVIGDASAGHDATASRREPPELLTVSEVAQMLRTTRKAAYAMVERGQLPGVLRIGRRVRVSRARLLDWLRQKCAPSPTEDER
jgi:excisionase family DNA binding protein